jgi:hypothetical protein
VLLFLVLVTYLLLNVVAGIIISSLTERRRLINELRVDIEGKCFICGLDSWYINKHAEGWLQHQHKSHNVFYYLYFLIYIDRKNIGDCSAVEKYVKDFLRTNNISFFPQGRCLSQERSIDDKSP